MLELRHLRNLTALAQRLNYARAAEDLGITQPTLSRSIQALERQLGVRLFDRDRSGVTLTPQGRMVAERAGFLLADADDLERQSQLSAAGEAGRIRFGMAPMPARALLPRLLSTRLKAAPDVANEVVVRDVQALWGLLTTGDIEFFVSQDGLLQDVSQARVDMLGHFPISLIVRAGHPLLAGDDPAARFPLLRSSWAGLPLPTEIRDNVRGAPNVVEDFGTLAAVTASSDAIWFSSPFAVTEELAEGRLCELPGTQRQEVRVVMYTLARRSLSPLAQSLKKAIRNHIKTMNPADVFAMST
ncbi:MAG TPA: LysR family transcriptional regulator [Sphingobium sp.]